MEYSTWIVVFTAFLFSVIQASPIYDHETEGKMFLSSNDRESSSISEEVIKDSTYASSAKEIKEKCMKQIRNHERRNHLKFNETFIDHLVGVCQKSYMKNHATEWLIYIIVVGVAFVAYGTWFVCNVLSKRRQIQNQPRMTMQEHRYEADRDRIDAFINGTDEEEYIPSCPPSSFLPGKINHINHEGHIKLHDVIRATKPHWSFKHESRSEKPFEHPALERKVIMINVSENRYHTDKRRTVSQYLLPQLPSYEESLKSLHYTTVTYTDGPLKLATFTVLLGSNDDQYIRQEMAGLSGYNPRARPIHQRYSRTRLNDEYAFESISKNALLTGYPPEFVPLNGVLAKMYKKPASLVPEGDNTMEIEIENDNEVDVAGKNDEKTCLMKLED